MVDDIRPPSRKFSEDEQNQDLNPQKTYDNDQTLESTHESLPDIAEEDGFVVIPEKTKRHKKAKNPFKKLGAWFGGLSKKQKILFSAILILVLGAGSAGAYALWFQETPPPPPPPPVVEQKVEPPKPTTEASKLTGVQINPELNKRAIISIQIENSPDARPQASLNQAGVVFEAIAEGGITRFNASYLEAKPDYIGPIRSVRPYYAMLAAPFNPVFVHAGGSGAGLAEIASLGLQDLDHGANGQAFQRVSDRYAPHNLYSSTEALEAVIKSRKYTQGEVKSFLRKEEKPSASPTAKNISMVISSPLYNTAYNYDAKTNSYKRIMAGAPHKDHKSGKQIMPKVVIAMVAPFSQDGIYSVYDIIGSGTVYVFQDGDVVRGTWKKKSKKEQIQFFNTAGQEIGLNPGQTWITLVKSPADVTYEPAKLDTTN